MAIIRKGPKLPYSKRTALVANRRATLTQQRVMLHQLTVNRQSPYGVYSHAVYPQTLYSPTMIYPDALVGFEAWYILNHVTDGTVANCGMDDTVINCGGPGSRRPGPCPTGISKPRAAKSRTRVPKSTIKPTPTGGPKLQSGGTGGRVTDATKAKFVGKVVGKVEQDHSASVEAEIASAVNGKVFNKEGGKYAPRDVQAGKHAIEIKALLKGEKQSISVHDDALVRKVDYMKDRPREVYHTVVVDDRDKFGGGEFAQHHSGHRIYYKRGNRRYSLAEMHPVKDKAELKKLLDTPDDKLPEKAKGSLPTGQEVVKLRESGARAKAARQAKDKAYKARIAEEKRSKR